jgi:hypothetical protein
MHLLIHNDRYLEEYQGFLMGNSAVRTGRMAGSFRVKAAFLLVKGRSLLLLAAAAANIDSVRYQCQ